MSNFSFHAPESKMDQTFAENGQDGLHEGILGRDVGIIGAGVVLIGILLAVGVTSKIHSGITPNKIKKILIRHDKNKIEIVEKVIYEIPETKDLIKNLDLTKDEQRHDFISNFVDQYSSWANELYSGFSEWNLERRIESEYKNPEDLTAFFKKKLDKFDFPLNRANLDEENKPKNVSSDESSLPKNDISSSKGFRAFPSKWKKVVIIAAVIIFIILVVAAILLFLHFRDKD